MFSQVWEPDTGKGNSQGLCLLGGASSVSPNLQALLPLSGKHEPDLSPVFSKVLVGKMRRGKQCGPQFPLF